MPTQDQIIPIVMSGGIETKVDTKSVQLGKLLTLENGVFERPGKIRKRNGFNNLGNSIAGGGTFSDAFNLMSDLEKNSLLVTTKSNAYFFYKTESTFLDVGSNYQIEANVISEIDGYELLNSVESDMCVIGNYEIYTYQVRGDAFIGAPSSQQRKGVQFTIKDKNTKTVLYQSNVSENNPTLGTKIVTDGIYAYQIRMRQGGPTPGLNNIDINKIDPTLYASNPVIATSTIVRNGTASGPIIFDAIFADNHLYLGYLEASPGNYVVKRIDSSLAIVGTYTCSQFFLSMSHDGTNLFILEQNGSNLLYYTAVSSDLSVVTNPTVTITLSPGGTVRSDTNNLATIKCVAPQTAVILTNIVFFSLFPDAAAGTARIFHPTVAKFTVDFSGVIFQDFNCANIAAVQSKIAEFDSKYWVLMSYRAPRSTATRNNADNNIIWLQQITLDQANDANVLGNAGRVLWNRARSLIDLVEVSSLPPVLENPTTVPELNVLPNGLISAQKSVSSLGVKTGAAIFGTNSVQFLQQTVTQAAPILFPDNNYFISSASPKVVSNTIAEENFMFPPEFLSGAQAAPSGGFLTPGVYQYYAVWEWVDHNGQVHQSIPSNFLSVDTTTSTAPTINVYFNPCVNTQKQGNYSLVLYRTQANQVTPYRMTYFDAIYSAQFTKNVNTGVRFTDGVVAASADAVIANNQILYTTGGILPNDPAPNHKFSWIYKGRVMLGGTDDANSIWYSKTRVLGEPVKFSGFFIINVDIAGGGVTAGGTLDDKCIFFKKNKIFYMYGDGPNDAGGGQAFSIPQEISSPVGCSYPKSVVAMPLGLMFKSEKGIFLLDRGLNCKYIGSPVEFANDQDVTSAIHLGQYNQVVFTLDNGTALFYDYLVDQWGTYTNVSAVGSTLYENQHTYVQADGEVKQQGGLFLDAGTTPIELKIGLPWIKLSGLSGFERAKQLMLVGENISAHTLSVSMAYDFDPTVLQTADFTSSDSVLQERIFLTRQKCEAVQVTITDNATSTAGEGYSLSELGILIGMKKGFFKVPSTKSSS